MSDYTEAPATRMLATHCAACGRPLVDAKSVEAGMGPDCRRKHGYEATIAHLSDEDRSKANRLVYQIALDQDGPNVIPMTVEIRALGFDKLADRILERVKAIRITLDKNTDDLVIDTPYSETFVDDLKRRVPSSARMFDFQHKTWRVATHFRPQVWQALIVAFPSRGGVGPKGAFVIPARLDYLSAIA